MTKAEYNKIDFTSLKDEDLYHYLTDEAADSERAEMVELLSYALMSNRSLFFSMLLDIANDRTKLVAVYPALGDEPTKEMELIGSITDGSLYLQRL